MPRSALHAVLLVLALALTSCGDEPWNDPNPPWPEGQVTYSSVMAPAPPKHLDPAISYASDESLFLMQIYEPPMGYHFLKRPYELVPLGVSEFPEIRYLDAQGNEVEEDSEALAFTRFEFTVREDARYQPHPAFARDEDGNPVYDFESPAASGHLREIADFSELSSRAVRAEDYVYGIKRIADPDNASPMLGFMAQYIVGMADFSDRVGAVQRDGGWLDLRDYPMEGLEVIDDRRYAITIVDRYPQFLFWMAMHFFSPIPWEAERFYANPGFEERNLTLDWWPVGSGPFMLVKNDPNSEFVLERNPNFREDYYPSEGEVGDRERGWLDDAGKRLPLVDRAVFRLEKSVLSLWTKFLQGYYDRSGENHGNTNGVFDQAFVVGPSGVELTEELKAHDLQVDPDVKPAIYYYGFNMRDPVVGGYSDEKRKLRRALQIAFDLEEYLNIFYKGNGIPAHSPIPPGIPGHLEGRAGINPYVYEWVGGEQKRRSIDEARRLMVEAGYPNGRDARTGEPLKIFIDVQSQAISNTSMNWMDRAFSRIGVQVEFRPADWARTREKLLTGNTQIFSHGWLADYPDPENFLFLLFSPESPLVCNCDGANNSSYDNPEYDALFRQMRVMAPGPARDRLVQEMVELYQRDAVWLFAYNPKDIYLANPWVRNTKRHGIAKGTLKYVGVDVEQRERLQRAWNQPVVWPLFLLLAVLLALVVPGVVAYRRRQRATVRGE